MMLAGIYAKKIYKLTLIDLDINSAPSETRSILVGNRGVFVFTQPNAAMAEQSL